MAKTDGVGGYVYRGRERTAEDVTRRARQSSGSYDNIIVADVPRLKLKEGETELRILPPTWKDIEKWGNGWEVSVYYHSNVGPDNGSYLCLDKMNGEPCPPCEARRESTDEEERDQLRQQWRGICWVIDRGNEKAGPQVWDMPATLFRDINARSVNKKTNAVICIDDPEEGNDIVVTREGTDKRTKYSVDIIHETCPIHEDEKLQARWMKYILENPLPEILNFQEAEYIEKVLSGKVSKKSEEEVEDTTTRPRRGHGAAEETEEPEGRLPRSRRRTSEEADPTGDEPADDPPPRRARRGEPEEEEADTRPSGRTGRRSGPEPEEEAEAEAPPPRRRPRAAAEDPEEEIPEESRTARKGLERLRPGARKPAEEPEEEEADPPPRRARR